LRSISALLCSSTLTWLLPAFLEPKKDGHVCWISDYQELNKHIECKINNLPKIRDILSHRYRYKYSTKLGISMQYYIFEFDEINKQFAQTIITISFPYTGPNISQEIWKIYFDHLMKLINLYISMTLEFLRLHSHCICYSRH
jgi:hypothetical protein